MKKLKKPNKRQIFATLIVLSILALAGYTVWQTWVIREDIGILYDKTYQLEQNSQSTEYLESEAKGGNTAVSYKVLNQYIEKLEVLDPETNYFNGEPEYIEKDVRVIEVEVTNNEEWVYTSYASIGTIDDTGRITRTITGVRTSQDKNYNPSGYSLELAPGGKGIIYLYFEDEGKEIFRLYDIDNAKELQVN